VKDVYFAFDSYDLRPDARETLKANADWLKAHPSVRVEIEGHCDERGTNQYNLALGAQRAQAAKDYLVTLGIARERLSTISYGEEVPVCREQTEECWQKNRRDRFVVIPERPAS
jgi:peptidoglycan-associated lipoprotein